MVTFLIVATVALVWIICFLINYTVFKRMLGAPAKDDPGVGLVLALGPLLTIALGVTHMGYLISLTANKLAFCILWIVGWK